MTAHELRGPRIESEFQADPDLYVIFATNGLTMGRIIAASKSAYCQEHQGDLVIFNANIIIETRGKIWFGDLNITHDFDNLKNVADQLKEDLYILMEGDARYGLEKQPISTLISKAKVVIKCHKKFKEKSEKKNKTKKSTNKKQK